ncbi:MAG TPA: TatD family hydrolase [Candidatus Limiplasma sp.]|nr:TatD family hydrolase [Candidatus Limiplasma sp.]HRX09092.1 TatD family hydrolase [Candidatus Limiplasma sp.]
MIDSHCHLEDERFAGEVEQILQRMKEAGVDRCILAGSDEASSERIVRLTEQYANVFGVVGVHPHEARFFTPATLDRMAVWLTTARIVGVGEIGLDYYYDHSPRDAQREALAAQIEFAYRKNVSAVFHVRDAHGEFTDMLRAQKSSLPQGVMHCYTGSLESAKVYLNMGLNISFSGSVTFKNARNLQEVARFVPLDRLLIETDSPYLAPVPMRGQRNEPAYVRYVAEKIADLRGMDVQELAEQAARNTERLFSLPL